MGTGKRWSRIFLVCVMTWACAFSASGTNSDMNDAKKKAASLEEEKKKIESTLKNLESVKQDTVAYVKQLDASLEQINQELAVLEGQISAKEAEILQTSQELEAAREREKAQYEAMKLRIQYMYEKGETSYLDLLFQSADLAQLLNRMEYITGIAEYDKRKMDEYVETRELVVAKELSLKAEREELLGLQSDTEVKHASVEQLLSAKSTELKNYEAQISSAENQISEYEKDIQAQEDKIRQIEAEIKRKEEEARKAAEAAGKQYNNASIGNINFIWPCPASSRVTSSFGDRSSPTEGASSNHKGMDIGASTGTNILAAASGEVIISTYSYSAGNYIMINHGGGVYTVYMHCSQLLASVGDQVSQGQVIAKVGSTGVSTGPHLHFGIRVNGTYVNPANYVSP